MSDALTPEPAIVVDGVSKSFKLPHEKHDSLKELFLGIGRGKRTYEKQQALKDISFTVNKGDFFGIVGRNGSGKSTLLKLLAEIYVPDKGTIAVNGKLAPFIELGVGFNQELTGRENIFLNGALLGFNRKEIEAMYDEIVSFAELEKFMDQKLKNYSSGMQVRLAFSIAIRANSDILLLDEVLAVGDAAFQQKCYNYFEDLKNDKKTVVFVSHDMGAVRRFCTRAIHINNGELTHQGTPAEIAEVYAEENIERAARAKDTSEDPTYSIKGKIIEQKDDGLLLEVSYESRVEDELYVGIAVLKDGLSVAETITPPTMPLTGKGKVTYWLDTRMFNAGLYHIAVALFKLKNREHVCPGRQKAKFIIKGHDPTKGAALKLENTWKKVDESE